MKSLIIANWKMNPNTLSQAVKLAKISDKKGIILCPPFVFLNEIKNNIKNAELGAQNCFWGEKTFTGEISPKMLKNLGVEYVILGHSERRNHFKETDELINKKIKKCLREGLKIIFCIGETKQEKNKGKKEQQDVIKTDKHSNNECLYNSVINKVKNEKNISFKFLNYDIRFVVKLFNNCQNIAFTHY